MSRKTYTASFVAVATALLITFANGESSDAFAQNITLIDPQPEAALPLTDEIVPIFVSEKVVQDVPETIEAPVVEEITEPAPLPQASSLKTLVATTDTSGALSDEMKCLAGAIYFEARGESLAGQLAVGTVIKNRAAAHQFPASYCGVVYQRSQFSFVKGGRMPSIKTASKAWTHAKALARIAHEGHWESEAADSLYFHAKYVSPRWSRTKKRRVAINTHVFYR